MRVAEVRAAGTMWYAQPWANRVVAGERYLRMAEACRTAKRPVLAIGEIAQSEVWDPLHSLPNPLETIGFLRAAAATGPETAAGRRRFESVWGAMADRGVDTYWEGCDGRQSGDAHYEYYGRKFGKSLCHVWSTGPVFLLPMYPELAAPRGR